VGLRERLDEDLKAAMRAKDAVRLSVIRGIKAAVLAEETKAARVQLDEAGIVAVIAREIKQRQEAAAEFARGGRPDLVEKAENEMAVLRTYLPAPLSSEELSALLTEALAATGASGPRDMGKVMGWLMPRVRGRTDTRALSELVKRRLAEQA
jgi:uncharacterized protein YqeY